MFVYDNDTVIVESFLAQEVATRLVLEERFTHRVDLLSGQVLPADALPGAGQKGCAVCIQPHSFRVLRAMAG